MTADTEIPKGYKLTEVGVIPEDWAVKSLDSMAFVTSGKRLPLGRCLTDHETPHPYIRVTDMRPGTVSLGDIKFVPRDAFPAIKRYRIFKDDIFISVAGTLGIVGKIPEELDGANLTENADRITDITCSRDYLLHILMSPPIQNVIDSLQTIGAQPKLALTRIRKFEIPLPPTKTEQEAIADALSDADTLIESLEQLLAKKRQVKQGAKQELLTGKKRLPGFTGEWEVTPFRDVLRHHSGSSALIKGKLSDVPLPGYFDAYSASGQDVWHHSFENEGEALIVSAVGSRCGKTFKAQGKWSAIANTHVVWPDHGKVDAGFLLLFLNDENFWLKSGSGQPFVLFKQSFARNLQIPPVIEQTAIAAVLSDMDAEIAALEVKLAKARSLKQGMMQELLTGRIRLV